MPQPRQGAQGLTVLLHDSESPQHTCARCSYFNVSLQHLHSAHHDVTTHICALTSQPLCAMQSCLGRSESLHRIWRAGSTTAAPWCHLPPAPGGQGGGCEQQTWPAECYAGAGSPRYANHSHCPAAVLQHDRRCSMLGTCCTKAAHTGLN